MPKQKKTKGGQTADYGVPPSKAKRQPKRSSGGDGMMKKKKEMAAMHKKMG